MMADGVGMLVAEGATGVAVALLVVVAVGASNVPVPVSGAGVLREGTAGESAVVADGAGVGDG